MHTHMCVFMVLLPFLLLHAHCCGLSSFSLNAPRLLTHAHCKLIAKVNVNVFPARHSDWSSSIATGPANIPAGCVSSAVVSVGLRPFLDAGSFPEAALLRMSLRVAGYD